LNFSYDVCVKVVSVHLLVMDAVLLAPDVGRLCRFFFPELPLEPSPRRPVLWIGRFAKVSLFLLVGLMSVDLGMNAWQRSHRRAPAVSTFPLATHGFHWVKAGFD